jgi:hypothetical protein
MTKRWNAGRVGYVFCFQLRDIIPPYQSQISFFILLFAFTPVLSLFLPGWLQWDSDAFLFCYSQMNMDDYPHCILSEDSWLRTTGRHHLGFP